MTNAAQINSEYWLCHGPEDGGSGPTLVGEAETIFHMSFDISHLSSLRRQDDLCLVESKCAQRTTN